jgi:uncharacterized repeat protein (TIGR03803 family)
LNDGTLYGTTANGGTNNRGTVFRIRPTGSGYAVIYSFQSTGGDGQHPEAGLIQGNDGALYGTTQNGGAAGAGTVFRVNANGSGYGVVRSFSSGGDALRPFTPLVQGSDGAFYGTTSQGGTYGDGAVFGLTTNGSYAVFYNFGPTVANGEAPGAGLIQGSDGAVYGTTVQGGDMGFGTVFRMVLVPPPPQITTQPASVSAYPLAPVTFGVQANGFAPLSYRWLFNSNLMAGATSSAVSVYAGASTAGGYFAIVTNIYGSVTSSVATLTLLAPTQALQSVVLRSFGATAGDGQWPMAGLMQASNGLLFGTTYAGGAYGDGTVFMVGTNGSNYAIRAQFSGFNGDAGRPEAAVMQGSDGALYGTTADGGAFGYGTVFRIQDPIGAGAPVLIHSFGGSERGDGAEPYAGLVQASDGLVYGTTVSDGASGYGTVFRLSTNGGSYSLRNSFSATAGGGIHPYGGVVQGFDGALYGSTYSGGTFGCGTVFRLASSGAAQWLHSFTNSAGDGAFPYTGLAQSSDGTLYGTTESGGAAGAGTVFGIAADGSGYGVRVSFSGTNGSGANPDGGVVAGNDGAVYGTTYSGGAVGYGTVFRVKNPAGAPVLEYIHSFSNTNGDGAYPAAGLLQAADGSFFGTISSGGSVGEGTIYEFAYDPRIAVPPTNRVVTAGSTVSLSVSVAGTGPFAYQWLFNSNPVAGATNSTLALTNVTTSQAGVYAVIVFGTAGTVTSQPASLGVVGAPVFTSVSRLADGNVRLTLNVVSNANYNVLSSSNLLTWAVQTNIFAASATIQITDLTATNSARRFYRATWLP